MWAAKRCRSGGRGEGGNRRESLFLSQHALTHLCALVWLSCRGAYLRTAMHTLT